MGHKEKVKVRGASFNRPWANAIYSLFSRSSSAAASQLGMASHKREAKGSDVLEKCGRVLLGKYAITTAFTFYLQIVPRFYWTITREVCNAFVDPLVINGYFFDFVVKLMVMIQVRIRWEISGLQCLLCLFSNPLCSNEYLFFFNLA